MPTDQQTDFILDEKESLEKSDMSRRAGDIRKVLHHIINQLTSFIQFTDEEQKEAGVYFGDRRDD